MQHFHSAIIQTTSYTVGTLRNTLNSHPQMETFMNIKISFKKLLSIAFISMAVVAVPAISQAHERGHRDSQHHKRSYKRDNYKHNHGHNKYKYSKYSHNYRYDKHRKHHYASNEYLKPRHVAALHRKVVFIHIYD